MHIMLQIETPRVEARQVVAAVRQAFAGVASGSSIAPGQFVVDIAGGGDVIHYPGILGEADVYAVKVSPYLPQPSGKAIVTAWTMLISTRTGDPLALINAENLTTERTAATSVLAADLLLAPDATSAAVIGWGKLGQAHARYLRAIRPEMSIRVYARTAHEATPDGIRFDATVAEAVEDVDLVMLCTSAAEDVVDPRELPPRTVVTSISTNARGAREIPVAAVAELEVYVDARTTVDVASELRDAASGGWDPKTVHGTLAELVAGTATMPRDDRVVYFRSVGLGIEDAAVAWAAFQAHQEVHP
ncbi:NAD(P)H-dependent anabolic L-arginine dehydrogenase DauB [Agromyces luteolus]|nr:NAD(P)H-dependent anabolic L-arginine dehydrogenase DauB [Agromyces luteolus]